VSCHEWELCIDACSDTCSVSLAARVQFGACHARHSRPCLREHARRAAGGWFSLMMAAIYACIMMLWQWGSTRKHAFFDSHSVPLESFLRMSEQARRRPRCLESLHTACVHSSAPSGQSLWARACMLLVMLAESYCECRTSVHHACLCAELRALAVVWCGIVSRLVW